ncbi:hypothetical protein C8R46DRAFT_1159154 [Mycena filopes]|nr:hypothetical protein C8R46DRAFT_1159154 [Mycena filopes]
MRFPATYKQIVLNSRPEGDIEPTTFRTETLPFNLEPSVDEVLVQVTWLSLDPAMRGWIRDRRSYMEPVKIGAHSVGELVTGTFGWTEFVVMKDKDVQKITVPAGTQVLEFLNIIGMSGLSAYFGLRDVCAVKPGEILVVSGAAGSVGSVACQLGKKAGATVYAIAGSQEKCDWLVQELGVDKAFNYKSPTFEEDFKKAGYIDAYFDNGARIALCDTAKPAGIYNYFNLTSQRAKLQGFFMQVSSFDYAAEFPAAREEMARSLVDGSIKSKFHIVEGLDQAPVTPGGNIGKLVVKVSEAPEL